MPTEIEQWLRDAWADRANTLIGYNFKFEFSEERYFFPDNLLSDFSKHIAAAKVHPVTPAYGQLLDDFSGGRELSGPEVDHSDSKVVVAVCPSGRLAKIIGSDRILSDLEGMFPAEIPSDEFPEYAEKVVDELRGAMRALGFGRSIRSAPRGRVALRKRASPSPVKAPHTLKAVLPNDIFWVTNWEDVRRILREISHVKPDLAAAAWRRILGLKTMFSGTTPNYGRSDIFWNIIFRVSFRRSSSTGKAFNLRRPTVFSRGYPDVYATFWPRSAAKNPSGWGKTLVTCAGTAKDGGIGVAEAVIRAVDLARITDAVHIGWIDRRTAPAYAVDVRKFAERRHRDELGLDIDAATP